MLKHVTYRSTSSLGRASTDLTCRGSSMTSDTMSLKGDLPSSPELSLMGGNCLLSSDTISLKDAPVSDTLSLKGGLGLKNYASDTISLHSALSFSSLATSRLSSRCSSTASLNDQHTTPVKVYLRSLRPDIEYKTMSLSSSTTCRQMILMILAKFRLRHRDPNLFFVTMEVVVRAPGGGAPARRLLVLEDHACPAELQQCRPRGEARFSVGVRRGGLLRVYDSILMPGSQYKSLLVSYRTTAEELVQLLLNCYNNKENHNHYIVHEVNNSPYSDRPLRPEECPLLVQSEWPRAARANMAFVLRRNVAYALSLKSRLSWRRSLDQASTDTESEYEDHNTTIGSLISASSVSSALSISSHSSLYSTGSVSSRGSLSSNVSVSSRGSLSSNASVSSDASSSSGVSSSTSPVGSPAPSPAKSAPRLCIAEPLEAKVTSKPPICSVITAKSPVSSGTASCPSRTSISPPTPVPRTILNTSVSELKSRSLPANSADSEVKTTTSQCRSTTDVIVCSSSMSVPSSSSSSVPTLSSSVPTLSSSVPTLSSSTPTLCSPTSISSSLSFTSTLTLLSSAFSPFSISTSSCSTLSSPTVSSSPSMPSVPSISTSSSSPTSSPPSSTLPPSTTPTSTLGGAPVEGDRVSPVPPPPPLPARRMSCCRNFDNCFYI